MSRAGTPEIESTALPAVKNLRSKFEQMALLDASPKNSSGSDYLHPGAHTPRPRALSNPNERAEQLPPAAAPPSSASSARHVRNTSSSSDLKKRAPPPPPPPPPSLRARKPKPSPSPASSPGFGPEGGASVGVGVSGYASDVSTSGKAASYRALRARTRTPPPPPPPAVPALLLDLDEGGMDVAPPQGGVASLINKFGSSPRPAVLAPRAQPPAHRFTSQPILSSSPAPMNGLPPVVPPRPSTKPKPPPRPRHSFPPTPDPSSPASPHVKVDSPFDDDHSSETETVFANSPDSSTTPYSRGTSHHNSISSIDSVDTSAWSGSSRMSSESDLDTMPPPPPPPAISRPVPRPPPRHHTTAASDTLADNFTVSHIEQVPAGAPPPLPSRRPTAPSDFHSPSPPTSASPTVKSSMTRMPPPPTRTIALGDRLPAPRRQATTSSDESGDEEDPKSKLADSMPDVSQASRREPILNCHPYSTVQMQITAHTSVVCAAGHTFVVSSHHHVKIYDLSVSEAPQYILGAREVGLVKELRVTSMEFRPARSREDQGRFVWLGTKDGHLFELDVREGLVVGTRLAVHSHAVTHIMRYGMSMVTLDENGKALVFVCEPETDDAYFLAHVQPRVARISDKQEFARIFAGKLWTSTRDPNAGTAGGGASRGPVIRVYDIFAAGSMGRSVLPTEHVGTVTSGTVIPSDPQRVYLGHEGGFVSIWDVATQDGVPQCVEVIKVSTSDVLTMEGVNDRLWVGGRQGTIATYDVAPRPWVLTTQWNAHGGLPVQRVWVDPYSIDKLGKLAVLSVGRDERVKTWDGMLGMEWIDAEVLKQEHGFASFRDVKILIMSWNMDAAKPDQLVGTAENVNLLKDVLTSVDSPDLIVFGFQEMIDLESRKMAAKTVLLGGGKKKGGSTGLEVSEKVTGQYKRWHDKLVTAVRLAMPPEEPYVIIQTENLVGLFTLVVVKTSERVMLRDISITTVKRGMGGRYGNKGGIVARMVIDDTSVCFINCHLAAGQHHVRRRNADAGAMLEERTVFKDSEFLTDHLPFVGGGDGSMVLDHEIVFMSGDMNYRIDQRRETVVNAIKAGDLQALVAHDQLTKEMKFNRAFRLRPFREGALSFPPTYKYDRRSDEFDTSEKRRVPAWCDRVLWRSRVPSRVELVDYRRYEANVSDHRPISAGFRVRVKSVQHETRAGVVREVEEGWARQERALLASVRAFYVEQLVI